jgi:hypothetical protein
MCRRSVLATAHQTASLWWFWGDILGSCNIEPQTLLMDGTLSSATNVNTVFSITSALSQADSSHHSFFCRCCFLYHLERRPLCTYIRYAFTTTSGRHDSTHAMKACTQYGAAVEP